MNALGPRLPLICGIAAFVALTGCGGGGGTTTPAPSGAPQVQLLVGNEPANQLSALQLTVTEARLQTPSGTETANLLATSRTVDVVAPQRLSRLLGTAELSAGSYSALRLRFDTGGASGRDLAGNPVAVGLTSSEVTVPLPVGMSATQGGVMGLSVGFDVDSSLSSSGSVGWLLTPAPVVTTRSSSSEPLDEIHGRVTSTDPGARSFVVDLIDPRSSSGFGSMTVAVSNSTIYFDDDGFPINEAAFFGMASAGTRVEAHGGLQPNGVFAATIVELEDDHGVAEIKGWITSLDRTAGILRMQIREVERGHSAVLPVLASLGNPAEIDVLFTQASIRINRPNSRMATPAELQVGQRIEVHFSSFVSPPFPASRVEIHDQRAEFEGTVIDDNGLPSFFVMRLEHHDPAVRSGRVASPSTRVTVRLDGSERIYLKLGHEPTVGTAGVLSGLRVRVRGDISGPATAPEIDADDVRVRTGRLDGVITGTDPSSGLLVVDWEDLDDPFGNRGALPDPVLVAIAAGARVHGDASSAAQLFQLWSALRAGESLEVRVWGIWDSGGQIAAHELKVDQR